MPKIIKISIVVILFAAGAVAFYFLKPGEDIPRPADINLEMELYSLENLKPNDVIRSPFILKGEMRGFWFFEASFPVRLFDGNGKEIAVGIAMTPANWMTVDLVTFETRLEFSAPATANGTLVLQKDNPSGLPENDQEIRIPVRFGL